MAITELHTAISTANMKPLECGSCTQCCRGPGRGELRVKPSPHYATRDNMGEHFLLNKPNGDCVHVTDQGCGVYENRPDVCKQYDCRATIGHPNVPGRIQTEAQKRT